MNDKLAVFAGGCFWCLEPVFSQLKGVHNVVSGYIGGHTTSPSYKQVCNGDTGHAEAIQIEFDPAEINYEELLEIFFASHDPTTPNRQGNDVGTQYRSAIFCQDEEQRRIERCRLQGSDGFDAHWTAWRRSRPPSAARRTPTCKRHWEAANEQRL